MLFWGNNDQKITKRHRNKLDRHWHPKQQIPKTGEWMRQRKDEMAMIGNESIICL